MTFWIANWLRAFGLTLLVELAIALPLLAPVEPRLWRRAAVVVVVNLATHPLVWFLFPGLAIGATARLALSEAWAVLAELAIYKIVWPALTIRRATVVSVAANAASVVAGLIWPHQ
ncbi:MAG TPA: hypothetical protein VN903_24255 [Polyangia bacterium]|nr:hypothetical protein [Polyangia bacterium]